MNHVMFDCETLATTADAVILSIGAIKFDLATGEIDDSGFYASLSIDSQYPHRRVSEDTLIWWLKQTQSAQTVFFEAKQPLREALINLSDWLGDSQFHPWSNGADFDLPMLAHAFTQHNIEVPWDFYRARCFRTWKNLPGAQRAPRPMNIAKHNALADALSQAQYAISINRTLFAPVKETTKS